MIDLWDKPGNMADRKDIRRKELEGNQRQEIVRKNKLETFYQW
jgi:hypothetical protein